MAKGKRPVEKVRFHSSFEPIRDKPRLAWRYEYNAFSPKDQAAVLELGSNFLSSLSQNHHVLEIGAGTGRLADFLLRRSKLKPENYELLDLNYGPNMPFVKKKVFLHHKSGRMKLIQADMFRHKYPRNYYDHIIVSDALVPFNITAPTGIRPKFSESSKGSHLVNVEVGFLKILVGKLSPSLRTNGSIRICNVFASTWALISKQNIFPGFELKYIPQGGLILQKK